MAITKRPLRKEGNEEQGINVDALIARGGTVAQSDLAPHTHDSEKTICTFTLRVPSDLLSDMDTHRKSRRVKVSRQQWILEAIEQRLEQEKPV